MSFICWARQFLMAQGQHMTDNTSSATKPAFGNGTTILYQDNTSSIRLEKNAGKTSSGKRTKHIDIRYFFVTDRVQKGEVTIEYMPTDQMIADYFTKPLQGSLFRKFRNVILGNTEQEYNEYKKAYYKAKSDRSYQNDIAKNTKMVT